MEDDIEVCREHRVAIVEGNYVLMGEQPTACIAWLTRAELFFSHQPCEAICDFYGEYFCRDLFHPSCEAISK